MDFEKILEIQGLNKNELAFKLGISPSYLSMLMAGSRKLTVKLRKKCEELLDKNSQETFLKPCQRPSNQHFVDKTPPKADEQGASQDLHCAIDRYQPRDVLFNNNKILRSNNEMLNNIEERVNAVSSALEAFSKLDEVIQRRVETAIAYRSKAIVAAYNHHITAQARVMVNTLNNLVLAMEDGGIKTSTIISILRNLSTQIENLKGYEPPNS